jgi:PadR family transcriptional regulator PadR
VQEHLVDLGMSAAYTYANKGWWTDPVASDLFVGTLDILILKAVSWGPRHGYAIGRWIRETTRDVLDVQEGALYPALHRLERKGLLAEEWGVTDTGREAKYYSLTVDGRAQLRAEVARWNRFSRAVSTALAASGA